MKKVLLLLFIPFAILISCSRDADDLRPDLSAGPGDGERLVLDVDQFPFTHLSEYHLFKGRMALQRPVNGVLPFAPINTLFTDYAHKFRFVWMPAGTQATYAGDHALLDMPDGTVLVKTFYYDHVQPANERRIIETRLMYKRAGTWEFANYIWNTEQTEAVLDMNGSFTPITWLDDNGAQRSTNYRIPSGSECLTCHKSNGQAVPIGPRPQNLNSPYAYRDGVQNQLARWAAEGYLSNRRPKLITTVPKWDDPSVSINDRVRAYVDINCAHCHRDDSHCDYRSMRFAFHETTDPENLGVCVTPDDPLLPQHTHIVSRGSVGRSLLHYRMAATDEAVRMPLLGRTIVHDEALALLTEWINGLSPACP